MRRFRHSYHLILSPSPTFIGVPLPTLSELPSTSGIIPDGISLTYMHACRLVGGASFGAEAQSHRRSLIFQKRVFRTGVADGNTSLLASSKALVPVQLHDTFRHLV